MLQRNPSSQLQGDKLINQILLAIATVFIAPFLWSKVKVAEVETLHHKKIKKSEKRFQKRFQKQIKFQLFTILGKPANLRQMSPCYITES